jgi:hypothetical protein
MSKTSKTSKSSKTTNNITNYFDILPADIIERIFLFKTEYELWGELAQLWASQDTLTNEELVIIQREAEISRNLSELRNNLRNNVRNLNVEKIRHDLYGELNALEDEKALLANKETELEASTKQISDQIDTIWFAMR